MKRPHDPDTTSAAPSSRRGENVWRWAASGLALLAGLFVGIGAFTFSYGRGASYLSNDPHACANCHAMQDHFDSWTHSSHSRTAVCNDCHLPHGAAGKWIAKADNGFWHSLAFTFGGYREPIQIKPRNRAITQSACIDCHREFVHPMLPQAGDTGERELSCVRCHADVGHAFHGFAAGSQRESWWP